MSTPRTSTRRTCLGPTLILDGGSKRTCSRHAPRISRLIAFGGTVTDELLDDSELAIFTYVEISETRGFTIRPPSAFVKEYKRSAQWLSKLLRHSWNKKRIFASRCGFHDEAYGIPMYSGAGTVGATLRELGRTPSHPGFGRTPSHSANRMHAPLPALEIWIRTESNLPCFWPRPH